MVIVMHHADTHNTLLQTDTQILQYTASIKVSCAYCDAPCVRLVVASNYQLEVLVWTVPFTTSFKQQAVEKALGRGPGVTLGELAEEWGVGRSTVQRWIREARVGSPIRTGNNIDHMKTEKRPQDWSMKERLKMVIACGALDSGGISALCREKGIYPYHVEQWKTDIVEGGAGKDKVDDRAEIRQLKHENDRLQMA